MTQAALPLYVNSAGSGDPVVLLHSSGMSGRQWQRLIDGLSATHRVLAPDFLGSGENPVWPDDQPFTFHTDLAAIEALIASLGQPVHLVGHSYGGFLALTYARKNPALVRSLAVYDPVAFGVLHEAGDADALADLARAEANPTMSDPAHGGSDAWMEVFIDYWSGPGAWRALPASTRASFLRIGRKVYLEVSTLLADRTPRAAYGVVDAPTLLLCGAVSPLAARRVVELLAAAMPRATVRPIAGAGHMGPITHGGAVNAAITAHVAAAK